MIIYLFSLGVAFLLAVVYIPRLSPVGGVIKVASPELPLEGGEGDYDIWQEGVRVCLHVFCLPSSCIPVLSVRLPKPVLSDCLAAVCV